VGLVGVLAEAFEVVGAVGGDVEEGLALAGLAACPPTAMVGREAMIAQAFGGRPNHLAILALRVAPGQVQPILALSAQVHLHNKFTHSASWKRIVPLISSSWFLAFSWLSASIREVFRIVY
jgi:hypothetical protein